MALTLEHIQGVAEKTRYDFEHRLVPGNLLRKLYRQYNPAVRDVDLFLQIARERFPEGSCGLTSLVMRHTLEVGEVIHGTYEGEGHTVWALDSFLPADLLIGDTTADQYDGPRVYVGALKEPWRL